MFGLFVPSAKSFKAVLTPGPVPVPRGTEVVVGYANTVGAFGSKFFGGGTNPAAADAARAAALSSAADEVKPGLAAAGGMIAAATANATAATNVVLGALIWMSISRVC